MSNLQPLILFLETPTIFGQNGTIENQNHVVFLRGNTGHLEAYNAIDTPNCHTEAFKFAFYVLI